jgi:hypothetical protein
MHGKACAHIECFEEGPNYVHLVVDSGNYISKPLADDELFVLNNLSFSEFA